MSFHIVCDSCTDLTEEDLKKGCYTLVNSDIISGWRRNHR